MNGGARAESGVRGVVPGRGFRSERGGGSKVAKLGRIAIEDEAGVLMTLLVSEGAFGEEYLILVRHTLSGQTKGGSGPDLIRSGFLWHA